MAVLYVTKCTEIELDNPVELPVGQFDLFIISASITVELGRFYGQNHPLNTDDVVDLDEISLTALSETGREITMNLVANQRDFQVRIDRLARFLADQVDFDLIGWIGRIEP